ncbi:MAG: GAF domain-containing protein [Polyangiaceae bacterium]
MRRANPTFIVSTAVEAAMDYAAYVSRALPLTSLLDGLPARISRLLDADVVSIYLVEGDGEFLVLRGNVGFAPEAQGTIRLRVGEGLTGLAIKERRPITEDGAPSSHQFRRFEQLDEDRFPVFLAVPVIGHDERPLGALVVQRKAKAFTHDEVVLATTATAPIGHALRQAALLADLRDRPHRRTGGGTRKVTLPGRPLHGGRALGAVAAPRRPAKDRRNPPQPGDEKALLSAFDAVEKGILSLDERARSLHLVGNASFLASAALMASDSRLRERAVELLRAGRGPAEALSTVAREVTRAATGIVGDPFLEERARDIEDIVDAVLMIAAPDARGHVPAKAVIIGERISIFDLLVTSRTQPSGFALIEPASPRTEVFARLLDLPTLVGVENAFRWASPGDVAMLDGDHGFLIINPSRAEVAALRAHRRRAQEAAEHSTSLPPDSLEEEQ